MAIPRFSGNTDCIFAAYKRRQKNIYFFLPFIVFTFRRIELNMFTNKN